MPVLTIKDPEAHAMAAELARRTGKSLTQVVKDALRERLNREKRPKAERERLLQLTRETSASITAMPVRDPRSPDEIIGYDEFGVPR